jgi:HK97 family phage prohead protease
LSKLFTKNITVKADEVTEGEVVAWLTTYSNEDAVGDIIEPGALDQFIASFDPAKSKLPMLFSHDPSKIIGEWKTLQSDQYGVKGTGILYTETTLGSDVLALLKRQAVASVSIGFKSTDYDEMPGGGYSFKQVDLVETSIVLNPANDQARVVSVKSAEGRIETFRLKHVLRDAGLNSKEIDALFHQGWKGLVDLRKSETGDQPDLVETLLNFKL